MVEVRLYIPSHFHTRVGTDFIALCVLSVSVTWCYAYGVTARSNGTEIASVLMRARKFIAAVCLKGKITISVMRNCSLVCRGIHTHVLT